MVYFHGNDQWREQSDKRRPASLWMQGQPVTLECACPSCLCLAAFALAAFALATFALATLPVPTSISLVAKDDDAPATLNGQLIVGPDDGAIPPPLFVNLP